MPWLKLDDGFADDPTLIDLSHGAKWADVVARLECARGLTDGVLSDAAVRRVLRREEIEASVREELVRAGRWHERGHGCPKCEQPVDDGIVVHGFLDDNPSRAYYERDRDAARERMRKVRARRSREVHPNVQENTGRSSPSPSRPVPSENPPPHHAASDTASEAAEEDEEADAIFRATFGFACHELARLALERRPSDLPPILNRGAWLKKTADERAEQHRERAVDLLRTNPTLGPTELADLLEPALAPTVKRGTTPACPDCVARGSRWELDESGDAVPCAGCSAPRTGSGS